MDGPNKKKRLTEENEYDVDNMTEEEISARLKEILKDSTTITPVEKDGINYYPKELYEDDKEEWDYWDKWSKENYEK